MAVCLIATGGTIASLRDPEVGAVRPTVSATDLAASVAGLEEAGLNSVEDVARVNGWNVTPELILRIAQSVNRSLTDGQIDGVVVTHGTDTIEETAFACDLLVHSDKPVVFAAAMRAGDEISADGPRNLLSAVRVAGAPDARGSGAVLVMNDEAHAARWVRKVDSFRTSAFESPGRGPVALLSPRGLTVLSRPPRVTLAVPQSLSHSVPVLQTYTGTHQGLVSAVVEATGATGLVLEGTGLGNLSGSVMKEVGTLLSEGLPVVVATRVIRGGTGAVYGGPGGGATLRAMGVIEARSLTAGKARLLLMILLGQRLAGQELREKFAEVAERLV